MAKFFSAGCWGRGGYGWGGYGYGCGYGYGYGCGYEWGGYCSGCGGYYYPSGYGYVCSNTYAAPAVVADNDVPATIVVNLPADSKLSVDGRATASARRTFVSPPLERGKTYIYNLKAEFDHEGRRVTASRQVEVRAGEVSRVTLSAPTSTAKR